MNGNEQFTINSEQLAFNMLDFWRFQYSNIFSLHGEIAEFIVARALGITEAQNSAYWTLWDITYRDVRIEVKATAYYHLWNEDTKVSQRRAFSIAKANGAYDAEVSGNKEFCRQNDIYVFCLNKGETKEDSYPLNLDNWEFFVVPTAVLNEKCKDNKSITLSKIKKLGFAPLTYIEIKEAVDKIIDEIV